MTLRTPDISVSSDADMVVAVLSYSYISFLPLRSLFTAHAPQERGLVLHDSDHLWEEGYSLVVLCYSSVVLCSLFLDYMVNFHLEIKV